MPYRVNSHGFFRFRMVAFLLAVAWYSEVSAALVFTRIANETTPMPAVPGATFVRFGDPVIRGQTIAFLGDDNGPHIGIYTSVAGSISTVADKSTPVPSQAGAFTDFGRDCAVSGNDVLFTGFYQPNATGVYGRISNTLTRIADKSTPVPGASGTFGNFNGESRSGISGAVVFVADYGTFSSPGGWSNQGIFTNLGGSLRKVAVRGDPRPDGGTFSFLTLPTIEGSTIAFLTLPGTGYAIMTEQAGVLSPLVNQNTLVPSHPGKLFTDLQYLSAMKSGRVSFFGSAGVAGTDGIYRAGGAEGPTRIVDTSMTAPGGGAFTSVTQSAVDGDGAVAFRAEANGRPGLYVGNGTTLARVIETTQTLDGKTLSSFSFGRDSFDNKTLVFEANFSDNTSGLYAVNVASLIPEPACGMAIAGAVVARTVSTRRRCSSHRPRRRPRHG